MVISTLVTRGALTAALVLAPALSAQKCWERVVGPLVLSGDDVLTTSSVPLAPGALLPLGFTFSLPNGTSTTDIDVSTNGWISLTGTHDRSDHTPTVDEFLADPARIAVGWCDLACDGPAEGVYFNTFAMTPTSPARAVVTWYAHEADGGFVWMQCELDDTGAIRITHRDVAQYTGSSSYAGHDMLVGVTVGGGVPNPGPCNLSAGPCSGPTIYELFPNPVVTPGSPRDIESAPTIYFFDNGGGGYQSTPLSCNGCFASHEVYGQGCPPRVRTGGFHELFGAGNPNDLPTLPAGQQWGLALAPNGVGGFSVTPTTLSWDAPISPIGWDPFPFPIPLPFGDGDDSLSTQLLPFAFPFGDNGATNTIQVDSNGIIYLNGDNEPEFEEDPDALAWGAPAVAALWDDLDASGPTGGGTVYFDVLGIAPNRRAVTTWENVPEFDAWNPNSSPNTFQVQLWESGDIVLLYRQVSITDGLVGVSVGGGVAMPPPVDVTSLGFGSFSLGLVDPMTLDVQAGTEPVMGDPLTFETRGLNGATVGATLIGLIPAGVPLATIGLPGCSLYTNAIVLSLPMTVANGVGTSTLSAMPIAPCTPTPMLFCQSIALNPGVNPFGGQFSNGLRLDLGDL